MEDKKCMTCGKSMNNSERSLAKRYKEQYHNKGVSRWVFKRNKRAKIEFARDENFKKVLPTLTKRKRYGAEYYHISEFKGD